MGSGPIERALRCRSRLASKLYTLLLSRQFGEAGRGVSISPPLRFANLQQIALGDAVEIHRDCWIHALGERKDESTTKIVIGSHSSIGMGATISAALKIVLGEYVLMARNVYISDHGHAFEDIGRPIMLQGIRDIRPVSIGDRTWLGQNVCVLPGVTIGKHCVVGANSVVISDLPDFCVAVGSPARIVKQFNTETQGWEKASHKSNE